jgi:hypothetical protein
MSYRMAHSAVTDLRPGVVVINILVLLTSGIAYFCYDNPVFLACRYWQSPAARGPAAKCAVQMQSADFEGRMCGVE